MNATAALNDELRHSLANLVVLTAPEHNAYMRLGNTVLHVTDMVCELGANGIKDILRLVAEFETFTEGNDPYGEHDFGEFEYRGESYFFKIDYYDKDLKFHSPDETDPKVTRRVLTIMHTSEY